MYKKFVSARFKNVYSGGPRLHGMKWCIKTAVLLAKYMKIRHFLHCACKYCNKYTENPAT